jgi:catalase (peroxidase I)
MYRWKELCCVLFISVPSILALADITKFRQYFTDQLPDCNDHARAWVRAAFHDAGTLNMNDGDGGADGSLQFELDRPENAGLQDTISFYNALVQKENVSMADAIVYGSKLAVEVCGGPTIPFEPGRIDAKTANPPGRLPKANAETPEIFKVFVDSMKLSMEETVALIGGGHTIAKLVDRPTNDPDLIPGDFDSTPTKFDNRYVYMASIF